ncbi:hypothetical protein LCGC14_0953100 [marine sediment metagenome]|uniref:Uncharacterized protein n=1 Tax=marine sediment metagenome TaxID=412755 RepID=A0A0F9NL69_9ZZZZ
MTVVYSPRDPVPVHLWGKDHWATFAYLETRIVDHNGMPDLDHMRPDLDRHPLMGNRATSSGSQSSREKHPTRLKDADGEALYLYDHDDWDCADDAEAAGFLVNKGSGINRMYALTDLGAKVASALRRHKSAGHNFHTFRWLVVPVPVKAAA